MSDAGEATGRGPINLREFRNCMGRFATGVTIVTTKVGEQVHGMTANGFMSVSLNPPLILVAVGHKAKLRALLQQSGRYGVSILSESQMDLSNHFAGRPDDLPEIPFIYKEEMPLLEGAMAHIIARVVDAHEAGDHTLYIARVEYLDYRDSRPLLYYAGGYHQLQVFDDI